MLNNWMEGLPGGTPLSMVNIPGTHDSATKFVKSPVFLRCQDKSIREQLAVGVRLFDIRLRYKDPKFITVHGPAPCRKGKAGTSPHLFFDDVFADCTDFLKANPSETVILSVKMDDGKNPGEFFPEFYKKFIENKEELWFLENRVPKLLECRGKMVLMRRCALGNPIPQFSDKTTGINFSDWEDQGNSRSDDALKYHFHRMDGGEAPGFAIVQDRYKHKPVEKWKNAAKPLLDSAAPAVNTVYVHFLSAAFVIGSPYKNSRYINAQFTKYKLERQRSYGWFFIDFIKEELAMKVIDSNF
ncbi:MAG: phosphatidylinositol-specific phospholipase C domain-containing protein [Oscillospiraceae bacterium]|nr:phosphatidylinositol-specific phospholipase C domain-containing protein [Oscillospiraceae bacterium]